MLPHKSHTLLIISVAFGCSSIINSYYVQILLLCVESGWISCFYFISSQVSEVTHLYAAWPVNLLSAPLASATCNLELHPAQEACCIKCQRAVSLQSTCGNRDPVRTASTHVVPTPTLKAGRACAGTKRRMKAPQFRPISSPLLRSSPPWWIWTPLRWQQSLPWTHSRYLRENSPVTLKVR